MALSSALSRRSVRIIAALAVVFALIQLPSFVVPDFQRTNPESTFTFEWDSPQTESLARAACYDCHSNETIWPWYSSIAPVSWLVASDVHGGRRHMNFSSGENLEAEDMIEVIRSGEMPPRIYLVMHSEADLSAEEQAQLMAGIETTFGALEGTEAGEVEGSEIDDDD